MTKSRIRRRKGGKGREETSRGDYDGRDLRIRAGDLYGITATKTPATVAGDSLFCLWRQQAVNRMNEAP